ncbi:arabinosyltransferase domain-containing protein [Haloechinothrix salitolerans]|uniref:Arabinosyltransferase domain-containing protein n=1 Tax=Haloechinothrix salitolerans TaxID=926830 RepID=A0ABW2BXN7_9PSEU
MLATACALAIPLLPVTFDTARIEWPHAGDTSAVNAPLTGYWAQDIDVTIPCDTVKGLDDTAATRGILLSTVPRQRMDTGAGMYLRVNNGTFTTVNRGQQIVSQRLPPSGCDIGYSSTATRTVITVADTVVFDQGGDIRPRVVGIYTDISAERHPIDGLHVSITPDTRYQSAPTVWKSATTIVGALSLIGCLIAVNRLDTRFARRAPRWAPLGWWKLTGRDVTVIGALGLWVIIGPVTSDDGYILSMARVADDAGYLTNYHRWFGVAEAPFGWFYHLTEVMTWVSTAPPWIRLPSFLLAVIAWLLISREILPRLGTQVRNSAAAGWAAAAVFLVWWMPFNNGVRPEPVAAVGALLAIAAVERALVTRRLLPLCLGVLAAALTLAATPTGLIAVAPFIVAAKPLFHLLRQRARTGWVGVLTPIAAAGFAVLMVVFADQTLATVAEATRLRTQVGPSLAWFQEFSRYDLLFGGGGGAGDDSLTRRFPVLLLLLCTMTCLVVILRRGRIPGAALGPSRRLIGTVALFFVLLALTPTKWTHHFGAFAGVGAAMAALTALATSQSVLRSARNRNAFLAALLVVAALATTGPNSYWFVSQLGVPWATSAPTIGPLKVSTMLLLAAVVAAVGALVQNIRTQRPGAPPRPPERRSRALALSSASLTIVCGLFALSEFATVATAGYNQRDSYSLATANIDHLLSSSCNMSDHVLVEEDPVANVLPGYPPALQRTLPPQDAEDAEDNEDAEDTDGTTNTSTANGTTNGSANGASASNHGRDTKAAGKKPNDGATVLVEKPDEYRISTVGFHNRSVGRDDPLGAPPQGFSPELVPMWSSYDHPQGATGTLRSHWFQITEEQLSKQLVVSVAGGQGAGLSLAAEYGKRTPRGIEILERKRLPVPFDAAMSWEDSRISQNDVDSEATAVRIVATDNDLTDEGWIAVTAPRVPSLTTLTARIGANPVYMDWPTSFVYPCLRLPTTHDGISEMPAYRITAGELAAEAGWADSSAGGPLGWMELVAEESEVPSFLAGEPKQSWGQLKQIEPLEQGVPPHVVRDTEVHSGWWSPGPGPMQPDGRTPTR